MPRLDFRWQLPYRYDEHGRFGPLICIGLTTNSNRHDMLCLLDTGAERTLLDGQHLRAAGLDLFPGTRRRVSGVLASSVVVYEHRVAHAIADLELELAVLSSTQPLNRAVIGRDLLSALRLGLRERAGEIYLSVEQP